MVRASRPRHCCANARPQDEAFTTEHVTIHYLRPPDRLSVFRQALVQRTEECIITLNERTKLPRAIRIGDTLVLDNDAPVLWLTFPDRWHDIGLFHTRDGAFTGYYANVLTPVQFRSELEWDTTDLFVDLWVGVDDTIEVLDEDELNAATSCGWITAEQADSARAEVSRLLPAARAGTWPPPVALAWTLERARATLRRGTSGEATG